MEQRVYFSRLKPEARELYLDAHRDLPAELLSSYAKAGVREVQVFLAGLNLVVMVKADDFARAEAVLAIDPVESHWQERMSEMKDQVDEEMEVVFHLAG